MTNDQLLEKLYEGSLTPDERSLLDTRAAESPEFAAEVQEFMTVVQLLDQEKQDERTDAVFLESTRSKVITLIAAASAAGVGGAAVQSGGLSSLAGSATQWIIAALGFVGVSSVVLWSVWSGTPDTPSAQRDTPPVSAPLAAGDQAPAPAESIVGNPVEQPVNNTGIVAPEPETPATSRVPSSVEQPSGALASASEEGNSPKEKGGMGLTEEEKRDYEDVLDQYVARLEQYRLQKDVRKQAQALLDISNIEYLMRQYGNAKMHAEQSLDIWNQMGDVAGRANAYKHIGIIYRENNELSNAVRALNQGISLVEEGGNDEIRGLLLGELAKVYEEQGNKRLALEKMNACVVLLRRTNTSSLADWENELKRLETSMK